MGLHAFDTEPEHCAVYKAHFGSDLPPLQGLDERWNMPAARHRRTLGIEVEFRGVDHYVLTYHAGGASARRVDASIAGAAQAGALSLQRPGSGGRFSSSGLVEYGHFYFKQSLVCEVADELNLQRVAEPEDFFALEEPAWGRDAEAYLLRSHDAENPATSLEMDGRAYLMVLGLLRTVEQRANRSAQLVRIARADMRRVVELIEDRIGETLRLSVLAAEAGMSPFHFSRVFKREIGESPSQYLLRRRTERAVDLIRSSKLSFAEVAHRIGFSSQSHMTRQIKALTGRTPTEVRSSD